MAKKFRVWLRDSGGGNGENRRSRKNPAFSYDFYFFFSPPSSHFVVKLEKMRECTARNWVEISYKTPNNEKERNDKLGDMVR